MNAELDSYLQTMMYHWLFVALACLLLAVCRVRAYNNGVAERPYMGWSTW